MNLETIRAFVEIASVGSFQQAADRLNITQSAISARVKSLEDSLNRQLFVRKRTGATLTAGGHAFHPHALKLLRTWQAARQETALDDELDDHVSVGVQLNHWQSITAPWLNWMKTKASEVATNITADYSDQLNVLLRDGLINIAIVCKPMQFPDVVIEQYTQEDLLLVSTKPRRVEQTAVEGYVFVDWGRGFRADHGRAFPNTPSHKLTVGLAAVGLDHILTHGGSGYFLAKDVATLLEQEQLYLVDAAPTLNVTTYLTYLRDQQYSPSIQKALDGFLSVKKTN